MLGPQSCLKFATKWDAKVVPQHTSNDVCTNECSFICPGYLCSRHLWISVVGQRQCNYNAR